MKSAHVSSQRSYYKILFLSLFFIAFLILRFLPYTEAWQIHRTIQIYNSHAEALQEIVDSSSFPTGSEKAFDKIKTLRSSGQCVFCYVPQTRMRYAAYQTFEYGDFYQYTYRFGLLWCNTDNVSTGDEALTLYPIKDGWFVYKIKVPQSSGQA